MKQRVQNYGYAFHYESSDVLKHENDGAKKLDDDLEKRRERCMEGNVSNPHPCPPLPAIDPHCHSSV